MATQMKIENKTVMVRGKVTFSQIGDLCEGRNLEKANERQKQRGRYTDATPYITLTLAEAQIISQINNLTDQNDIAQQTEAENFIAGKFFASRKHAGANYTYKSRIPQSAMNDDNAYEYHRNRILGFTYIQVTDETSTDEHGNTYPVGVIFTPAKTKHPMIDASGRNVVDAYGKNIQRVVNRELASGLDVTLIIRIDSRVSKGGSAYTAVDLIALIVNEPIRYFGDNNTINNLIDNCLSAGIILDANGIDTNAVIENTDVVEAPFNETPVPTPENSVIMNDNVAAAVANMAPQQESVVNEPVQQPVQPQPIQAPVPGITLNNLNPKLNG